ncbi:MAG: proline racemase family protein [Ferroplasma sp.]
MSLKADMILDVIDTHTEGEPTRILFWNKNPKKFDSVFQLREYFKENYDFIRKAILFEPRGHRDQFGAIIFPPVSDNADYSLIFATTEGYLDMCGHATIGVSSALISMGMMPFEGKEKTIIYDTVAGKVSARVKIEDGEPISVSIIDVESYYSGSCRIMFNGREINIDVSYGGNFYAIAKSEDIGIEVKAENIDKLVDAGNDIREKVHEEHKDLLSIKNGNSYPLAMIIDSVRGNEIVIFSNNSFDRSPCGTGTAARSALLFHKGELTVGQSFINRSITGTEFKCTVISSGEVNGKKSVVPEITGRAWITQLSKIIIGHSDPFKYGFLL